MLAVPTGAEQPRERIGRPDADADAVRFGHVEWRRQIVRMADFHGYVRARGQAGILAEAALAKRHQPPRSAGPARSGHPSTTRVTKRYGGFANARHTRVPHVGRASTRRCRAVRLFGWYVRL